MRRVRRWSMELGHALAMCFLPTTARFGKLYDDVFGVTNLLGEESMYVNFGYWKDNPSSLDEACRDLARLLAREARLDTDDVVVDVGCGYGDQDLLWANEFGPRRIVGVNVTDNQIAIANSRSAAYGLADRVSFTRGTADRLPQASGAATKVMALESAFHFPSRPEFFAEAFRVLRPGGRIAIADMVPLPPAEVTYRPRVTRLIGVAARALFCADRQHPLDVTTYSNLLRKSGFDSVRAYSIREEVYLPFAAFIRQRLADPDMKRVNPLGRLLFGPVGLRAWVPWLDYVVVVADKPISRATARNGV